MGTARRNSALILAAHGERRASATNRSLLAHATAIEARGAFDSVTAGVLRGAPALERALAAADASGAGEILIYPFFMSDGIIVREVMRDRIAGCRLRKPVRMLTPLGLAPQLLPLLDRRATAAAAEAGFARSQTRLLVVAHGSRISGASAAATRRVADLLDSVGNFSSVDVAFIEEPPLVANQLAVDRDPVVVLGFFSGEGMHSWDDVPAAIEATGARAVYTGPIGADAEIPDIIMTSIEEEEQARRQASS